MTNFIRYMATTACVTALCTTLTAPAVAGDKAAPIKVAHCEASLGTLAVVEGDTQGWTKYGLGSPRPLIMQLATESGCFTPYNAASGKSADFLMNAVAGDKEEVDQAVNVAKTALIEGAVRSGAVGQLAGHVPVVGGMLGMFGGMGGKKKTVAAGLRVISPASGMTIVSGSGQSTKSVITFAGGGAASALGGYGASKDGQMLSTAFVQAFNAVIGQSATLIAARPAPVAAAPVAAPAAKTYLTAIDTKLYGSASKNTVVRTLRAATALTPTGKREGLFVEVKDAYGTQGWASVEDLK